MDKSESEEIINYFLKELRVFKKRNMVSISYTNFFFELPIYGNLVSVYLKDCYNCPVDCFKRIIPHYKDKINDYIDEILKKKTLDHKLSQKDIILLSKISVLKRDADKVLDLESIKEELKLKLRTIKIVLIGLSEVGKSTIFEYFPGNIVQYETMVNTFAKFNDTFKPLLIQLIDPGMTIIENIASESIAPLLKNEFSNVYMFILVTDSTSKNVMNTKHKLLPKLRKINPNSLIICIANKQDNPNTLNFETVQNILNVRTYPLTAIDSKSYDLFMNIIWETIILRIEQMKEHQCFFFKNEI
ncbi:MAG: ADP-ribosylation factor-like protein [Candidatus Helarchaeota archaeon]